MVSAWLLLAVSCLVGAVANAAAAAVPTGPFPFGYTISVNVSSGVIVDGPADVATFQFNQGPSIPGGRKDAGVYFTDSDKNVIRRYLPATKRVETIAGDSLVAAGSTNGSPLGGALFSNPTATAVLSNGPADGVVYVADENNHCVRAVPLGGGDVSTVYGICQAVGTTTMNAPTGLALLRERLFVCDSLNDAVKELHPSTNTATTIASFVDFRPKYITIADETLAFVVSSNSSVWTLNLATGAVVLLSSAPAAQLTGPPSVDRKGSVFYMVASDPLLTHSIYKLDYSDRSNTNFVNLLTFANTVEDGGPNPKFRNVKGIVAIHKWEILILEQNGIRGLFLEPPPTGTKSLSRTRSASISSLKLGNVTVNITDIKREIPRNDTRRMAIVRTLMLQDATEATGPAVTIYNATDLPDAGDNVTLVGEITVNEQHRAQAESELAVSPWTRTRGYLATDETTRSGDGSASAENRFCQSVYCRAFFAGLAGLLLLFIIMALICCCCSVAGSLWIRSLFLLYPIMV